MKKRLKASLPLKQDSRGATVPILCIFLLYFLYLSPQEHRALGQHADLQGKGCSSDRPLDCSFTELAASTLSPAHV